MKMNKRQDEIFEKIKSDPSLLQFLWLWKASVPRRYAEVARDVFDLNLMNKLSILDLERDSALNELIFNIANRIVGMVGHWDQTSKGPHKYCWTESDNWLIVGSNVQPNLGICRKANFRKYFAQFNNNLQPQQLDLFIPTPIIDHKKNCIMLMVRSHPRKIKKFDHPSFIGIGVPNESMTGWIFKISLDELFKICKIPQEVRKRMDRDDHVYPQLRKEKKKDVEEE